MPGQGAIIAAGAIDYPAEYHGTASQTRAILGISKVMTLTCTYDHRISQGAESGAFLGRVQALLDGQDGFYEEVFDHLRMPHRPVHWETDRRPMLGGLTGARTDEIAKEAAILQMINAYRVRGHLIADLDPLGAEPSYHPELDPETYGLTIWDLDREFLTGNLGHGIGEAMSNGVQHPASSFRCLLPFGNHLPDLRRERGVESRFPTECVVQKVPAFGTTGDILFDPAHVSLGKFLQGVALHLDD